MTSEKHDPVLYVLVTGLTMFALAFIFVACGGSGPTSSGGVVDTTTTTVAGMTFADCQKSAEYPGGRYSFDYDNGVCNVQKPSEVAPVEFASCAEAADKGFVSMRRGEAGYSSKLDRDGDGVACDS